MRMHCADEGFALRRFVALGGMPVDYACERCGWMQASADAGARELLNCATWHTEKARAEFIEAADKAIPGFARSLVP
jgi:hypothetical protein